jgi:hypothetical protein
LLSTLERFLLSTLERFLLLSDAEGAAPSCRRRYRR